MLKGNEKVQVLTAGQKLLNTGNKNHITLEQYSGLNAEQKLLKMQNKTCIIAEQKLLNCLTKFA